jgi:hypothetical protein
LVVNFLHVLWLGRNRKVLLTTTRYVVGANK